ncbi:MAG: PilZ domain-containing protein [Syntrophomonadaceae bacterium]|nr:PilZ domain-containing protein [Syntrophomonadaceae bacterium]
MKLNERIAGLIVLVATYILYMPSAVGAVDWNQFQGTVTKGFSNEGAFDTSKIATLVISIMAIIIIIIVVQWWSAQMRKQQQISFKKYKEKQKEIEAKTQNPAQMRKWFRLAVNAQLRWMTEEQADHVRENKYFADNLVDISAEGLCFSTAEELLPGTHIRFILDIGEKRDLLITGEALRIFDSNEESYDSEGQKIEKHNVAIKFGHMTAGDNDRLVAWITKRQRDAMKKTQDDDTPNEFDW